MGGVGLGEPRPGPGEAISKTLASGDLKGGGQQGRRLQTPFLLLNLWISSFKGAAPRFLRQPLPVRPHFILPTVTEALQKMNSNGRLFHKIDEDGGSYEDPFKKRVRRV